MASAQNGGAGGTPSSPTKMRADKWLWHARFFKTRGLATKLITGSHLRVNGDKVAKAAHQISVGDVLTFPQARDVRVVEILSLSTRRGPAPEAQALYKDLSPPAARDRAQNEIPTARVSMSKYSAKGRPSKKDRRNLDKTRLTPLD